MRSYIFTEKERRALLRWLELEEDSSLLRVTLHRLRLSIGSLRRDLELLRLVLKKMRIEGRALGYGPYKLRGHKLWELAEALASSRNRKSWDYSHRNRIEGEG